MLKARGLVVYPINRIEIKDNFQFELQIFRIRR